MSAVLRGELTLDAAAQDIKYHTHRFIRHQYAWFRPPIRALCGLICSRRLASHCV